MTATIKILTAALLLYVGVALSSCHHSNSVPPVGETDITVSAFSTGSGWGYQIYTGNRCYIRQPFVPAVSGKRSFASRQDAMATGNLVKKRMAAGNPMPVITQHDLQALNVSFADSITTAKH